MDMAAIDHARVVTVQELLQAAREKRDAGEAGKARELLREAAEQFPAEASVMHDLARLAEASGDWLEAEQCWRGFTALNPASWFGPNRVATVLVQQGRVAEAEELVTELLQRFPEEAGPLMSHAHLAETRGDWPEARARWQIVTERVPQDWNGLAGQARALRLQGRQDEARTLLSQAAAQFSTIPGPLHELARLAYSMRDWTAAEQWYRAAAACDPGPAPVYTGLAAVLWEQGRRADAEAVLMGQFERMAHEPAIFIEYAKLADLARDWPESQKRWFEFCSRFQHLWIGYAGQLVSLRQQKRLSEAAAVLVECWARFPNQAGPFEQRAYIAEAQSDWAVAEAAWKSFIVIDQNFWWAYTFLARSQCRQGRVTSAFETFREARARFPSNVYVVIEFVQALCSGKYLAQAKQVVVDSLRYDQGLTPDELLRCGELAVRCEALDQAIDIANLLTAAQSADPRISSVVGRLKDNLKMLITEIAPDKLQRLEENQTTAFGIDDHQNETAAPALMMRFESLGGDYPGCEIGLVQRRFGADPLGLLRWTTVQPNKLIQALEAEFEGVGEARQTELTLTPNNDYKTKDTRFHFDMVSFISASEVPLPVAQARTLRRITYLRRKMLDDLAEGHKIFVYRTQKDTMTDAEVLRLKAAMSRYGHNKLLYLKLADQDNVAGSVCLQAPDLCFGYVERFSNEPNTLLYVNGWLPVLQKVAEMWPAP